MCIAIANKNSKLIDEKTFITCWNANEDGFGMASIYKGKIVIDKEINSVKLAYEIYKNAFMTRDKKTDVILHFRISTSGKIDIDNCHPFFVNKNFAMCHNGVLSIKTTEKKNDTRIFIDCILNKLPNDFPYIQAYKNLIQMAIGSNKFLFLDRKGKCIIFNESLGIQEDGNWYSNSSYKFKEVSDFWRDDYFYSASKGYHKNTYLANKTKASQCDFCNSQTNELKYSNTYNGFLCKECYDYNEKEMNL